MNLRILTLGQHSVDLLHRWHKQQLRQVLQNFMSFWPCWIPMARCCGSIRKTSTVSNRNRDWEPFLDTEFLTKVTPFVSLFTEAYTSCVVSLVAAHFLCIHIFLPLKLGTFLHVIPAKPPESHAHSWTYGTEKVFQLWNLISFFMENLILYQRR